MCFRRWQSGYILGPNAVLKGRMFVERLYLIAALAGC
jgi:hypothetical protein